MARLRLKCTPAQPLPVNVPRRIVGEDLGRFFLLIRVVGPSPATVYDENGNAGVTLPAATLIMLDIKKGCQAAWYMMEPGGDPAVAVCNVELLEITRS